MIRTNQIPRGGNAVRRIMDGLKEFGIRITDIGSSDNGHSTLTYLPEGTK